MTAGVPVTAARWMLFGEWRAHPARVVTAALAIAIGVALGYLDFRFAAEPWRDACPKLAAWFAEVSKLAPLAETVPVG